MKLAKLIFLSLACAMHAAPVAASAASPAADDLMPTSTPTITAAALADLEAAQAFIRETHPGAVPGIDKAFLRQLDAGFGAAVGLAAQLPAQDQAIAALKAYTVAFNDDHLAAIGPERPDAPGQWAGWTAAPTGQRYLVRDVAPSWQGLLPAPGDELVRCDGQPIDTFLQTHIAPFVDRRYALEGVRASLALLLTNRVDRLPLPASSMPRECTFRSPNGIASTLPMVWTQSKEGFRMNAYTRAYPGVKRWLGGYWVYANDFDSHSSNRGAVDQVARTVASIPPQAPFVVFDTRGNQGGSGLYGYELLSALLKGDMPSGEGSGRSRWRVSTLVIEQLGQMVEKSLASEPESARTLSLNAILAALIQGQKDGKAFIDDDAGIEMYMPPPQGEPFKGRVILITDSSCASACMDFVDMVRRVPGMLHVGRETSGDTNYLEIIRLPLPSGATLVTPTKVWSGRARGINESAKPHEEFLGDIRDTRELRKWLAERLQRL